MHVIDYDCSDLTETWRFCIRRCDIMAKMASDSVVIKTLKSLTLADKNLDTRNGKELGRGAYGRVFTVKYCGQTFAAKEIHSILLSGTSKKQRDPIIKSFLHECHHCVNLRHPNVVQFIGVYWPNQRSNLPVMVMELMDCSLTNFIEKQPREDIELSAKYSILHDVALGLGFLHAQTPPVLHRDLSPNNVLLTDRGVAKLGDLGVAKAVQAGGWLLKKNAKLTEAPGMASFMPPEALCCNPVYDTSLDVFSFGGIVIFVITEQWPEPTVATEMDLQTHRVVGYTEIRRRQKYLREMDTGDQQELRQFVESCLDNDPQMRPIIRAAVEKIESLQSRLHTSEVSIKLQPPPSPQPKPRHISAPIGPVPMLPDQMFPHNFAPKYFPLMPPLQSRDHYRSMPDSLNITTTPPRERRKMRVSFSLGEALQNDNHHISWTRCADLPGPMYGASVAVNEQSVFVAAGCTRKPEIGRKVFCYDTISDRWSHLPSPDHSGILCMVDGKLNLFGGINFDNNKPTDKVSTFNASTNKWVRHFPPMLKKRNKPGVAVYLEYIIVAGGARDINTFNNDIEVLNWQQSSLQWRQANISLPVPMWMISLTISSDMLLIVGYTQAKGRSTSVYQIPVKFLVEQPLQAHNHTWKRLCSAPHHDSALVPNSNPPVIIGGNFRGQATSDICVYNASENHWKNCDSLSGPRINVAVASIYDDTIIVFGGFTSGRNIEATMESSLTTVEMGKVEENGQDDDADSYLEIIP